MSLNFNGAFIGGTPSGGSFKDPNFLAGNTIIKVGTASDNDFTKLKDATDFINNKWSNGTITIEMANGSNVIDEAITIDAKLFNIPCLIITGKGVANTSISSSLTTTPITFTGSKTLFIVHNFTLTASGEGGSIFNFTDNSIGQINNVNLIGNNKTKVNGINCARNSNLTVGDYTNISNVQSAIHSDQGGKIVALNMSNSIFNNCTTGFNVSNGSIISGLGTTTPTYTNVTNKTSQTVGSATTNGWISRIPV